MSYDYKKYGIIYVDDETQALKYFKKAFEKDFTIFTAASVAEAMTVLEERDGDIGVLVTDQRMPEETGTDLLEKVKRRWPDIVRVLTTAYSDLDSAIEAVNSGGVFRYVTKPWNLMDLRGVLLRAMEFFLLQRERDILLRQKLSVLQRIVVTDRVRALTVLAAGLTHHIRNSMNALAAFLDLAPREIQAQWVTQKQDAFKVDLLELAKRESKRILEIVSDISDNVVDLDFSFSATRGIDEIILPALQSTKSEMQDEIKTCVEIPDGLPPLKVDEAKSKQLFHLLLSRMVRLTPSDRTLSVRVQANPQIWQTQGVSIFISGGSTPWTDEQVSSFFTIFCPEENDPSALGLDLLSAFFIAHHHGGDIVVNREGPNGPGFEVLLPFDPEASSRPHVEIDCLEKVFRHFEAWDTLMKEI